MDYAGTAESFIPAMRQFMSLITPLCGKNGDSFIHKVDRLVKTSISTLEQAEKDTKKQWNVIVGYILSIASLVVEVLSWTTFLNAIEQVTRKVRHTFNADVPKCMKCDYHELERLLAAAEKKLKDIQSKCETLVEEVAEALEKRGSSNPINIGRLEASSFRVSVDIGNCEQILNRAHEKIKLLRGKASDQLAKFGLGFLFSSVVSVGLGALSALLEGATLRGILGCASFGSALACVVITKEFSDHLEAWEKVEDKRSKHDEFSNHLKCLKKTFETRVKEEIERLKMMPDSEN